MSSISFDFDLNLAPVEGTLSSPNTPVKASLGDLKPEAEELLPTENGGLSELEMKTPISISQQPVSETQSAPLSKRGCRREGESDDLVEFLPKEQNPEWLPEDWRVKIKTRPNGKAKDKYYIEAETQRQFRSKREVLEYIKTGVRRSHKKMKTGEGISNATPLTTTQPESKWDTPPEKLTWVLASSCRWAAFIGEEPVPEHKVAEWQANFNGYHS